MGALAAAVAVVVPNAFFAWHAQRERSAAMFLGIGVLRWFASIALMVLAFWWWRPPPLGFLGTLVLLQLAYVAGGLRGR